VDQLAEDLEHRSGLVAVGGTSDVAVLEARAGRGDPDAELALAMFASRAAAGIAAAATVLPGLDAVVFTGGIGEHAVATRGRIVAGLSVIGLEPLDAPADGEDAILSRPQAPIAILRVEAREELVIARHVQAVLEMTVPGGRPA
jgi:acetate kinase